MEGGKKVTVDEFGVALGLAATGYVIGDSLENFINPNRIFYNL